MYLGLTVLLGVNREFAIYNNCPGPFYKPSLLSQGQCPTLSPPRWHSRSTASGRVHPSFDGHGTDVFQGWAKNPRAPVVRASGPFGGRFLGNWMGLVSWCVHFFSSAVRTGQDVGGSPKSSKVGTICCRFPASSEQLFTLLFS